MNRLTLGAAALMLATAARAQAPQQPQQPDPALMQGAIQSLQAQRNAALDAQATAEARLAVALHENATLKKRVDDLQKPVQEPPK